MNKNNIAGYSVTTLNIILTSLQDNPIYQTISLVITILGGLLTISFTIYKWYKDAIKDGKITKEEISDAVDKVSKEVGDLTEKVGKDDKNGKN